MKRKLKLEENKQESKALELAKMRRQMDKSLLSSCHHFHYKLSHSLFLSFAEFQKEEGDYKSTKKTRENPYNSLKNTSSSLQVSPLTFVEALGVYLQAPEDEALKSRPWDQNAGSTARFLPRIRGQSRVSAAESWPLRQRFLLPFCYSLLATWIFQKAGYIRGRLQIWARLLGFSFFSLINPIYSLIIP